MIAALWPVIAVIIAFELGILCGAFLVTRREPADDREDEHSQILGAEAGFLYHPGDL